MRRVRAPAQNYPLAATFTAPAFTTVSVNNGTWWVGAYVSNTGYPVQLAAPASGSTVVITSATLLRSLDGLNFAPVAASALPPGFSPTWAQTAAAGNPPPSVPHVYGFTWRVPTTRDRRARHPAPLAARPADAHARRRDNKHHGWVFGDGFVLATHNGGLTWRVAAATGTARRFPAEPGRRRAIARRVVRGPSRGRGVRREQGVRDAEPHHGARERSDDAVGRVPRLAAEHALAL